MIYFSKDVRNPMQAFHQTNRRSMRSFTCWGPGASFQFKKAIARWQRLNQSFSLNGPIIFNVSAQKQLDSRLQDKIR